MAFSANLNSLCQIISVWYRAGDGTVDVWLLITYISGKSELFRCIYFNRDCMGRFLCEDSNYFLDCADAKKGVIINREKTCKILVTLPL